jgi:hypothetical protein
MLLWQVLCLAQYATCKVLHPATDAAGMVLIEVLTLPRFQLGCLAVGHAICRGLEVVSTGLCKSRRGR